jgi:hypothetical protein
MPDRTDDNNNKRLTTNIETIRQGTMERVEAIKRDLTRWIDQQQPVDAVPMMIALLETAFDRYVAVHGEADALDFIHVRRDAGLGGVE